MTVQTGFYMQQGLAGIEGGIDPIIYLTSTLFTIGAGLCFIRVYPLLISLIYRIGRRFWSPVPYAALHNIMDSGGREGFLMLFIILSISVGLFNAGTARTINRNTEDRIFNSFGADIVTRQYWRELDERGQPLIWRDFGGSGANSIFIEPPFIDFQILEGVESTARVMSINDARVQLSTNYEIEKTVLIAFDPYDFARTAWWRSDLTPHAFNEYMNIMMEFPSSAVLSGSLRDQLGLREGDKIRIDPLSSGESIELDVLAFVDYWPSFSPHKLDSGGSIVSNHMVAANLEYIFSKMPRYPYDVWIRKMPGVSDGEIFDQLAEMNTSFRSIETITKPIVDAKNDPALQGTNGALSLGFIISMLISGIGFLIYWILSINSRALQFGVIRAMGLTRNKILGIIVWEQILVSGVALAAGLMIGNISLSLFLPVFSLLYSGPEQNTPFKVFPTDGDATWILLIFGIVLLVCLILLGHVIRRVKIDQVVKLGED